VVESDTKFDWNIFEWVHCVVCAIWEGLSDHMPLVSWRQGGERDRMAVGGV
jgi:hypothetical protein